MAFTTGSPVPTSISTRTKWHGVRITAASRTAKSYPAGHVTYRGELVKIILDLLREAAGPMTTREVGRHIMVERGLNTADDPIVKTYTRRAGALLRHYRERGMVRSIKDPRGGQFDLWEIAR